MARFGAYTLKDGDITEAKIADDAITEDKIEDLAVTNAKLAGSIAYSKLATDPRITRTKTGTYTGDGTLSQAITGIGFTPKYIRIWEHATVEGTNKTIFEKSDQFSGELAQISLTTITTIFDNRLISLDTDGFTVDDNGTNSHPNKANQAYNYMALG